MHGGDRRFASMEWERVQATLSQQHDDAITVHAPALRRALGARAASASVDAAR
jgi:hypothetical protein